MAYVRTATVFILLASIITPSSGAEPLQPVSYKGQGWWLQVPYLEDSEFTLQAEYGKDYVLDCKDATTNMSSVDYWVIPDMTILDEMNQDEVEYYSLDGTSLIKWIDGGQSLNLTVIVEDQFGFYFCHGMVNGDRKVIKRAVNYNGPYFGDLWEIYRMNTIVGCSSAAAFLVIVIISYCCYEWKFSDDDDDDEYRDASPSVSKNGNAGVVSYGNNAYDEGDVVKRQPGASASVMVEDSTML